MTYPSLDLIVPDIPQRSRLYSIRPIGLGTPYVESLISYICRLAESHSVSFGSLYELLVVPSLNKTYLTTPLHLSPASTLAGSFRNRMKNINGVGKLAQEWVGLLEALTLRDDLRLLSLTTLSTAIPHWKLLRTFQAWCPECYEQWFRVKQPIYQPLLWAIEAVDICIQHGRLLVDRCPYCQRQILPLTRRAQHGYCPRCGYWLGEHSGSAPAHDVMTVEERTWRLYAANNVGNLLANLSKLSLALSDKPVAESLHACIAISTGGVISQFARLIRKHPMTVHGWYRGTVKIPFLDLLRICYCLDLSIINFLNGADTVRKSEINVRELPEVACDAKIPRSPKPFNHKKVESQLINFLRLTPPISMAEAARRVGVDSRDLYRKFPELCSQISSKYRDYLQESYRMQRAEREEEVRQAVIHLYSRGIYVSPAPVAEYLNKPSYLGRRDVAAIIRETRERLDSEKKAG